MGQKIDGKTPRHGMKGLENPSLKQCWKALKLLRKQKRNVLEYYNKHLELLKHSLAVNVLNFKEFEHKKQFLGRSVYKTLRRLERKEFYYKQCLFNTLKAFSLKLGTVFAFGFVLALFIASLFNVLNIGLFKSFENVGVGTSLATGSVVRIVGFASNDGVKGLNQSVSFVAFCNGLEFNASVLTSEEEFFKLATSDNNSCNVSKIETLNSNDLEVSLIQSEKLKEAVSENQLVVYNDKHLKLGLSSGGVAKLKVKKLEANSLNKHVVLEIDKSNSRQTRTVIITTSDVKTLKAFDAYKNILSIEKLYQGLSFEQALQKLSSNGFNVGLLDSIPSFLKPLNQDVVVFKVSHKPRSKLVIDAYFKPGTSKLLVLDPAAFWWSEAWRYRAEMVVKELSGSNLTNYSVMVRLNCSVVNFSQIADSGRDLRFTYNDSGVERVANFWIEDWSYCNATVWVKIPFIGANSNVSLYMYYGNNYSQPASNPDSVFQYFVNFTRDGVLTTGSSQDLTPNQWEIINDTALHLWGNNWKNTPMSVTINADGTQILEALMKGTNTVEIYAIGFTTSQGIGSSTTNYKFAGTQNWGITPDTPYTNYNQWQKIQAILDDTTLQGTWNYWVFGNDDDSTGGDGQPNTGNVTYKNVRIRAYTNPEPVVEFVTTSSNYVLNVSIDQPLNGSKQYRGEEFFLNASVNCSQGFCPGLLAWAEYMTTVTPTYYWVEDSQQDFESFSVSENVSVSSELKLESNNTPAWWDASWIYRMPINVSELSGSDLENYSVEVLINTSKLISEGRLNSDCSDLRFVYNGSLLDYWVESGCNTSNTTIWVEIPFLAANNNITIYLYYGNPSAESLSNPDSVFQYFVNFTRDGVLTTGSDQDLTPDQWEIINDTALHLWGNNWKNTPMSVTINADGKQILEALMKGTNTVEIYAIGFTTSQGIGSSTTNYKFAGTQNWGITPDTPYTNYNQWQKIQAILDDTTLQGTWNYWVFGNDDDGGSDGGADGTGSTGNVTYKNVRIRAYTNPEPSISVGDEQVLTLKTPGVYVSNVFDPGSANVDYKEINYGWTAPSGTALSVYVRTSSDNVSWSDWYVQMNGSTIEAPDNRFIQYKVVMSTDNTTKTPVLDWVRISYEKTTGSFSSITSDSSLSLTTGVNPYDCGNLSSANLELFEDFNDGNYSDDSPITWIVVNQGIEDDTANWTVVNGMLSEQGNAYDDSDNRNTTALGTFVYPNGSYSWTDFRLKATLMSEDDDGIGLMFRFVNSSTYYRFKWQDQADAATGSVPHRRLEKFVNNAWTVLANENVGYDQGKYYTVVVEAVGDNIKVYVDNELVFNVTDDSISNGSVALYSWGEEGAYFDDIEVWDLSSNSSDGYNNSCQPAWGLTGLNLGVYSVRVFVNNSEGSVNTSSQIIQIPVYARTQFTKVQSNPEVQAQCRAITLNTTLLDDLGQAVKNANVSFYDEKDSVLLGFNITNNEGVASININLSCTASLGFHDVKVLFNGNDSLFLENASRIDTQVFKVSSVPVIHWVNASPKVSGIGLVIGLTANVSDVVGLDAVLVNITKPDLSTEVFEMQIGGDGLYYYNYTAWIAGNYSFIVIANNTDGITSYSNASNFSITARARLDVATEKQAYKNFETVYIATRGDDWWNNSWLYRKAFYVHSNVSIAEYQLFLNINTSELISAGKLNPDCSDLRFVSDMNIYELPVTVKNTESQNLQNATVQVLITDEEIINHLSGNGDDLRVFDRQVENPYDNESNIAFWVEGVSESGLSVWVRIPYLSVGEEKTLYFYYGNPNAESESNYSRTFPKLVGEVGTINVSSSWGLANFSTSFEQPPIVVSSLVTVNENDAAAPRIANITANNFSVKVEESVEGDGSHSVETVDWMAVIPGNWIVAGKNLQAGNLTTNAAGSASSDYRTVSFYESFATSPVVLSHVDSFNDPEPVHTRMQSVTSSNFQVKLEETNSSGDTPHDYETIGWIALSNSYSYDDFSLALGTVVTDENWASLMFYTGRSYIAKMQTENGGDNSHERLSKTSTSASVRVEEETGYDGNHITETFGWIAATPGLIRGAEKHDLQVTIGSETALNTINKELDFYVENCNSSNTTVIVQTPAVSASQAVRVYMYYGNPSAESASNLTAVFSYDQPRIVGYVVSEILANNDLQVLSLDNNNQIIAGSTTLNLDLQEAGTIPASSLTQGTAIKAKSLFQADSDTEGTDIISPASWAGTQFTYDMYRYDNYFAILSPWGNANVTIYDVNTQVWNGIVDNSGTVIHADIPDSHEVKITSNIPILVQHYSLSGSTYRDATPFYPSTTQWLYGVPSNYLLIGGNPSTSVEWNTSNGQNGGTSLDANGAYYKSGLGSDGSAQARRVKAQQPIGAQQLADSDGTEMTIFLPITELGTRFGSQKGVEYIAIAAPYNETTCTVYDASGNVVATQSTTTNYPVNKICFNCGQDNNILVSSNWRLECNKPVYAYFEEASKDDETMLLSWKQMRQYVWPEPTVAWDDVEEKAYTGVHNLGNTTLKGYLYMAVQHWDGGSWNPVDVPIVSDATPRTINPGEILNISKIWSDAGAWSTSDKSPGLYRVVAKFLDVDGSVIVDSYGNELQDFAEFRIVEAVLNFTSLEHENLFEHNVSEYEAGDVLEWVNITVQALNNTALNAVVNLTLLKDNVYAGWGPNSVKSCGNIPENSFCELKWDNESNGYIVPLSVPSGSYTFVWRVLMNLTNGQAVENKSLTILVHNTPSTFKTNITPRRIYINTSAIYNFTFTNLWTVNLTNVTVTLNCPDNVGLECKCLTTDSKTCDLGIVTPNTNATASFNITANSSAITGNYYINATLNYSNIDENRSWIGYGSELLEVRSPGLLEITVQDYTSSITRGSTGFVKAFINNTASENATNATLNYTLPQGFVNTSSLLEVFDVLQPGSIGWNNLTYNVTLTAQLGANVISLNSWSDQGQEDFKELTIYVYANTSFEYFNVSDLNASVGEVVVLQAKLVMDNGNPVQGQSVVFKDLTDDTVLGVNVTNDQGIAVLHYNVSETANLGLHSLLIDYSGNNSLYLNPSNKTTALDIGLKPNITSVWSEPSVQGVGFNVSLYSNVTDDDGINFVTVNVTMPNGSVITLNMTNISDNTFLVVFNDTWLNGSYSFKVTAVDVTGSSSSKSSTFNVQVDGYMTVQTEKEIYSQNQDVLLINSSVNGYWWSSRFPYRKKIVLQNPNSENITDYQKLLFFNAYELINASKLESDCSNLRFVVENASGVQQSIDYWIEDCYQGPTMEVGLAVVNASWTFIAFNTSFDDPVVVANPISNNTNDSIAPRINVTENGFYIKLQAPQTQTPTTEQVAWIAIEQGTWTLPDGTKIEAHKTTTDKEVKASGSNACPDPGEWLTLKFNHSYSELPVILAQVQTFNDPSFVTVAVHNDNTTHLNISMEVSETCNDHGTETIGWIAVESNKVGTLQDVYRSVKYETIRTSTLIQGRDDGCFVQSFTERFTRTPVVIATKDSRNDLDGGWLRRCSLNATSIGLFVEEDQNDSERSHNAESAGIIAFEWPLITSSKAWVKIPLIPANSNVTLYMYYGANVSSNSSKEAVFTGKHWLVSDEMSSYSLSIVSFYDNNTICTDNDYCLTLNAMQVGNIPAQNLSANTSLHGEKAFIGGSENSGSVGDVTTPESFLGKRFVMPAHRGTQDLDFIAVHESVNIKIYDSSFTKVGELNLSKHEWGEFSYNFADGSAYMIVANASILAHHEDPLGDNDYMQLYPETTELWGILGSSSSTSNKVSCSKPTFLQVWYSDGSQENYTCNAGETVTLSAGGSQGVGPGVHIIANDSSIGGAQVADSDGTEGTVWLPTWELDTVYYIPQNAEYLSVLPTRPSTNCTLVTTSSNTTLTSTSYEPPRPQAVLRFTGNPIPAGSYVVCDKPVFAYYERYSEDAETNLYGVKQVRNTAEQELQALYFKEREKQGSRIENTGGTPLKGLLVMTVERFENNNWQWVATIVNNSNSDNYSIIQPYYSLDLASIWNANPWNTGNSPGGLYRVKAELLKPNGEVIITNSNVLNATDEFNISQPAIIVNITSIKVFDVTNALNKHLYSDNLTGQGLNTTFTLISNRVYRVEVHVSIINGTLLLNQTSVRHEGLNSSWIINETVDIWYKNDTSGEFQGGVWNGTVVWNTSLGGSASKGSNLTFAYVLNLSNASVESRPVLFKILHALFEKSDASVFEIVEEDNTPPGLFNNTYNVTPLEVIRSNTALLFARWNEHIANATAEYETTNPAIKRQFNITLPEVNPQNWTNHTITTDSLWYLGIHHAKIYVKDDFGNENETPVVNFTVYGLARVVDGFLIPSVINVSNATTIYCKVGDHTKDDEAIADYVVYFYNSTDLLGTNTTNASGWASFTFTDSTPGVETITCNVTENISRYYKIDSYNEKTFTLKTLEHQPPYWVVVNSDKTVAHKTDTVLLRALWRDNLELSSAVLSVNTSESFVNVSTMQLQGNESWANFTYTIPASMTPGNLSWLQYANDSSNNWNQTPVQVLTVWGWSKVESIELQPASIKQGNSTRIVCKIVDANNSVGLANYTVYFYNSTGLLGTNTTNASGYAFMTYTDNTTGQEVITCNITDNTVLMYNASSENEKSTVLNTVSGDDVYPPVIINNEYGLNDSLVKKGESLLIFAHWNESINHSYVLMNTTSSVLQRFNISPPYTNNWTNYTIVTNNSWIVGVHAAKIVATDQYGNTNDTLPLLYFNVTATSAVAWHAPKSDQKPGLTTLQCYVFEEENNQSIQGYTVYFYNASAELIGTNVTNSEGIASFTYNTSQLSGVQTHSCRIYSQPELFYSVGTSYYDSYELYFDSQAPSITLNYPPPGFESVSSFVNFNFTAIDDRALNMTCNLTINGIVKATLTAQNGSATNKTLQLAPGFHEWQVSCSDIVGNIGFSELRNLTVLAPDNESPEVELLSPLPGTLIGSTSVVLSYNVSDLSGVANCSLIVNNVLNQTDTDVDLGVNNFTLTISQDMVYNWSVNCTDIYGNVGNSSVWNFTADLTPPAVFNLVSPENDSITNNTVVTFNWTPSSDEHFTNYTLQVDDNPGFSSIDFEAYSFNVSNTSLILTLQADKWWYWRVIAFDAAGNSRQSEIFKLGIDQTPPVVELQAPPDYDRDPDGNVSFVYYASDMRLEYCALYTNISGVWQVNQTDYNVVNGTNMFYISNIPMNTTFKWNVKCVDNVSLEGWNNKNWTVIISEELEIFENITIPVNASVNNSPPIVKQVSIPQDIVLNAGTVKTITCNATIEDANGPGEVVLVNASFYYVDNASSSDDDQVHYTNASCNFTQINELEVVARCSFNVWYFARNGSWVCNVSAFDSSSTGFGFNVTNILPLAAVDVNPKSLNYGSLGCGDVSEELNVSVVNLGNVELDLNLYGYASTINDGKAMVCDQGSILSRFERFSLLQGLDYEAMQVLGNYSSKSSVDLNLAATNNSSSNASKPMYWRVQVPSGASGSCNGHIVFEAMVG